MSRRRPALLVALLLSCAVALPARALDPTLLIAPVKSSPEGQTYGRWAAQWWQWALGVPAATNPLTDTTGQFCGERQVDEVWFLGGTLTLLGPAPPVVRSCRIPTGKSLFFPLINNLFGAFLNDPPEQRTEAFAHAAAACTVAARISVQIDGFHVLLPTRFFTGPSGSPSPTFNVQLSPGNVLSNLGLDIPELVLSPSAEQGYYLFVRPLPPGQHTIRWVASGCAPGASQDVTYHLTVGG